MLQYFAETPSIVTAIALFAFAIIPSGCNESGDSDSVGPPAGKTGNEWTSDDFANLDSALAEQGGPEFGAFCKEKGTCEIEGEVFEKFKEIVASYPIEADEERSYFAVVVREGLIEAGLLPEGDPNRYQYKVSTLIIALSGS